MTRSARRPASSASPGSLRPARSEMPAIAFRRFAAADFQQVFLWLLRPHVARGYATPPGSFTEFVAKYGARPRADSPGRASLGTVDATAPGYIQARPRPALPRV